MLKTKDIEQLELHYTPYPRDAESLEEKIKRQRAEKYSHLQDDKENIIREHKRPIKFYTTLDWDKFYMNFPVVKRLSKDYLNNKQNIYNEKLAKQMEEILTKNEVIINILNKLP